jgi:hypothetical protein
MTPAHPPQVLWQLFQWRCEYAPITPHRGVFRLDDADVRVIEAECSPELAATELSNRCRALVETAEYRPK